MVAVRTFERDPRAIQRVVAQLHGEGGYDAILIADGGSTAERVAAAIRAVHSEDVTILGTELWNTQPTLANNAAMRGALFASVSDRTFDTMSQRYRTRFTGAPYRLSSLGYDAALLAVRLSSAWEPGSPFPMAGLLDNGGFSGVDGAFRFHDNGIAERALEVQRIQPGNFAVVDPAPSGFGG